MCRTEPGHELRYIYMWESLCLRIKEFLEEGGVSPQEVVRRNFTQALDTVCGVRVAAHASHYVLPQMCVNIRCKPQDNARTYAQNRPRPAHSPFHTHSQLQYCKTSRHICMHNTCVHTVLCTVQLSRSSKSCLLSGVTVRCGVANIFCAAPP